MDRQTDKVTDTTNHLIHASAIIGMGNYCIAVIPDRLYEFIHPETRAEFQQLIKEKQHWRVTSPGCSQCCNFPLVLQYR